LHFSQDGGIFFGKFGGTTVRFNFRLELVGRL
jgi:hypothetical protein